MLNSEIEGKHATQICQAFNSLRQEIQPVASASPSKNGIMNIENAPKEIVKSVVDLANLAKELMDENQELSVQQELERLFPSTRSGGRGG